VDVLVTTECRWCKYSVASLVDYKPLLMCLFWRRQARDTCPEFEREPGADDDFSQPDDGQTSPDHFHQSPKEGDQ
jgi:hypothetical protein